MGRVCLATRGGEVTDRARSTRQRDLRRGPAHRLGQLTGEPADYRLLDSATRLGHPHEANLAKLDRAPSSPSLPRPLGKAVRLWHTASRLCVAVFAGERGRPQTIPPLQQE